MATSSAPFEGSWFDAVPFDAPGAAMMALSLDHDDAMVGVARHTLASWLHEHGCRDGDDAVLVLSELVTNALVHGAAGCTVEVRQRDDLLRLEVWDPSREPPVLRTPGPSAVGGQGLRVVDALAEEWGWEPDANGKRVWAIVRAAIDHPGVEVGADPPSR